MKCSQCSSSNLDEVKIDHPYDECGLPNVTLVDVTARKCRDCGTVRLKIPAIEELHRALLMMVLRKNSRLTGAEVRFLRKYIGLSGTDFARRIGAEPETVSRWENDRQPIGPQAERLLRLLVVTMGQIQEYPIEEFDRLDPELRESTVIRIQRRSRDWSPAA